MIFYNQSKIAALQIALRGINTINLVKFYTDKPYIQRAELTKTDQVHNLGKKLNKLYFIRNKSYSQE